MSGLGVLLTAHGTVERLDELPGFLSRIRHGRPAPAGLVEELARRYAAIGGSPLLAITEAQRAGLSQRLGLPVYLGMRLWRPELRTALEQAHADGNHTLCVLPLAPFSVHVYQRAAEQAAEQLEAPFELRAVAPFAQHEAFLAAELAAIEPFLTRRADERVVLTAHSLPTRVIAQGDPYATQVRACAEAIERRLGRVCTLAFQSQGVDGGEWLGPDLRTALQELAGSGCRRVVLAPFGFLSDHVETLYDLDIEARTWAHEFELEFVRVPALNASPGLLDALEAVSRAALFG